MKLSVLADAPGVTFWNLRPAAQKTGNVQLTTKSAKGKRVPWDGFVLTVKRKDGKSNEFRGTNVDDLQTQAEAWAAS